MSSNSPGSAARSDRAQAVLQFWFEDGLQTGWPTRDMGQVWFGGGAALDSEIERRFGSAVREAAGGGLSDWESHPLDRLALILLLDQMARNVFRGKSEAFAGDTRAQALATDAYAQGWDARLPLVGRAFLAMPLMHAESLPLQQECVRRFEALCTSAPPALTAALERHLASAREHLAIIAEFGRFPHRNAVRGRPDTAREQAYLRNGPRFGQ